jgi:hypothetical protein
MEYTNGEQLGKTIKTGLEKASISFGPHFLVSACLATGRLQWWILDRR